MLLLDSASCVCMCALVSLHEIYVDVLCVCVCARARRGTVQTNLVNIAVGGKTKRKKKLVFELNTMHLFTLFDFKRCSSTQELSIVFIM